MVVSRHQHVPLLAPVFLGHVTTVGDDEELEAQARAAAQAQDRATVRADADRLMSAYPDAAARFTTESEISGCAGGGDR